VGISDIAGALRADPGRAGTAEAERHLALARAASGSPAETLARLRMHEADLHPELQAWLVTPTGRRVRPDFLFRAEGLVVEIEGYAWRGTREAHRNDVLRFNELGACREVRRTLRFTAVDVYRCPERLIETIRAALTALRDQEGRG
jgi:hypothetical protein